MPRLLKGWVLGLLLGTSSVAWAVGLAVGAAAPGGKLLTFAGKSHDIHKFAAAEGKRNLLLLFFRTGNCSVCTNQLRDIAGQYDAIQSLNAAVLAVSMDDAITQKRTAEMISQKFPILMDPEGKLVKAYDVLNPDENLSRPAVYLISRENKVLYRYVGMSLADRPPLQEVMDVVRHYSGGLPTKGKARP